MLPRLGCMSGLLRPVGPETAQTYWVRRALIFGDDGARGRRGVDRQRHQQRFCSSSESVASHCRISNPELRFTKLDADSHGHASSGRAFGFSNVDPSAEGHHTESVDEEGRSEWQSGLPRR